jgi:hypothetical protein
MAKPLTPTQIDALTRPPSTWSQLDVFELALTGMIQPSAVGGGLELAAKALRALKRESRAVDNSPVMGAVTAAVRVIGKPDQLFRLDDVLKLTGLPKAENRDKILSSLRALRDLAVLETVKLSDNNFQIYWRVTPEGLEVLNGGASEVTATAAPAEMPEAGEEDVEVVASAVAEDETPDEENISEADEASDEDEDSEIVIG